MKIVLSWLKEFVDIDMPLEELAKTLTDLGLEVSGIQVVGLPIPEQVAGVREFPVQGLSWAKDKFVVAEIREVMPHPNADRLVLCRLFDGSQELVVLTGAPNLFDYKGKGMLQQPLKVAYAREGATLYDGHQPGFVLTTLKKAVIRGVESFSMVCSEKELGISEEHEGIIILDADAPAGLPLADYMGDAVLDIGILPNMIRNASMLGVARELAATSGKSLRLPDLAVRSSGVPIKGQVDIQITDPLLNPRFMVGLIKNTQPVPSPYWVQRRLRLAGMRPINSIVDATNYVMLETGQPLHAFDYDVLIQRAKSKTPTIITRAARPNERLMTLDGVERTLDEHAILVCDKAGALSIAGVMGGMESEVTPETRTVLLEGAAWNYINIRRTAASQRLSSEAAFRFARGIHPALAEQAVYLGLKHIAQWSGGEIANGLVDAYPQPYRDPRVTLTLQEVHRAIGAEVPAKKIVSSLSGLGFVVEQSGDVFTVQSPPTRVDIQESAAGKADVIEEIARLFGYDNIPARRLEELMPPVHPNPIQKAEEALRDTLVRLGLQEVMTYRMTDEQTEAKLIPPGGQPAEINYVRLKNPLSPERSVLRRSLLSSVLETARKNSRLSDHLALFEIGPVFLPNKAEPLPEEAQRLAIVMSGMKQPSHWSRSQLTQMDFFDLKGIVESFLSALRCPEYVFEAVNGTIFHPGKTAEVKVDGKPLGIFGELHPQVKERYEMASNPVLAAEFDLDALLPLVPDRAETESVSAFPPVLEDIALIVDESLPAAAVEEKIWSAGGKHLKRVELFDVFRGDQLGEGKKSLAYNLTYQAPDRTLSDKDAAKIRQHIIFVLGKELNAKLRSI